MASSNRVSLIDAALTGTTTGDTKSIGPRASRFVGYLRVPALGAGTSLAAKIQHSPDGVKWFDLVSFTAVVAADAAEVKYENNFTVASSPVLGRIRGVATFTGGTTTATVQLDLWYDDAK